METPDTDEELMGRLRAGGRDAIETLFERHHRDLYRFFRRSVARPDAAEDLVQEVFLRVLKYAGSFRTDGTFRGWLYAIARNAAADDARETTRRREQVAELSARERVGPAVSGGAGSLSAALAGLSTAEREVLVLARLQGLTGAELGEALGCSTGAARVRVHRALARLRDLCKSTSEVNAHALRRVD